MPKVRNISNGPRGAYLEGVMVMAEAGQVIEADDFSEEWFEPEAAKAKPEPKPEAAKAKVDDKKD